jgi:mannitol/fructose-specific phosphotransferase system IIA component (Ntr-type)
MMKMSDFLKCESVRVPLLAGDKIRAIRELVELLHAAGEISDLESVLQAVLQRERIRSTGIGAGLAVPHAKSPGAIRPAIAVGKLSIPMDFESSDGQPCRMIVLLVCPPSSAQSHIQALAMISRLWISPMFRDAALAAQTSNELYDVFSRFQS